ncbi:hypothetical protein CBA19CS22_17920 [Caballeronia novacaledonica]|uniref:Uncharacterized protein n=1 Tax=Caballeronia novacaledonica TaxID=1544861 RepID=A0ACB5QTY3_9BURK|nr:hypothetical protein CBA19CS22_17920 [Caballeronia novacaledonica]
MKREQAGIGRAPRVPVEYIGRIETAFDETKREPPVRQLGIAREIDVLKIAEHIARFTRCDLDRKDGLAALTRLHEFGETPFRAVPVRCEQRDHSLALPQLPVERLLPGAAAPDAEIGVEIKKERGVALPLQPCLHALGRIVVCARMTDEDGRHF